MSADIIVSYDGTANDDDALALGRALAAGGATLALAYVRHSREPDPRREELAELDAQRRLDAGRMLLGDPSVATHVVISAATDTGLEQLALTEGAQMIVFGSDYRTTPGYAEPGNTAWRLLDGAPVAIAVARAGLRADTNGQIKKIRVAPGEPADLGSRAAQRLAAALGAQVVTDGEPADLILVTSQAGGRPGHVALSGAARKALNAARGSVVILPAGATTLLQTGAATSST